MSTNPGTTDQPSPTAALVTGATGGIGRAICLALAALARQQGRPLRIAAAAASRPGVALDALLAELTASAPRPTSPRPSATSPTPPTSPARAWWSTAAWRTTC
jgi:NAD(P)-dependent dehydrogenase (short-subunit alcohol dehydrogenase family)